MPIARNKHWKLIILTGDITTLYAGLFLTLWLRYEPKKFVDMLQLHLIPFSALFLLWLLLFYIAGLYEARAAQRIGSIIKLVLSTTLMIGGLAIMLFYFIAPFGITPRANLLLNLFITSILMLIWRLLFVRSAHMAPKKQVLLYGSSEEMRELALVISENPQLGYDIALEVKNHTDITPLLNTLNIDIVVAPREMHADPAFVQAMYNTIHAGARFIDAAFFYERVLGKIPLALISKIWFLENIVETEKRTLEHIKRGVDLIGAIMLGIATLPILPIVALCIKLDSSGPIFIKQKRVGLLGKEFILYKYRTMVALSREGLAEEKGAVWAEKNDKRITRVGRFLRTTRIDELPQLWNVLRGDLSFIGPRPERPEFVSQLRGQIPYYDMRHLVRPGLSGWAQINPPYYYGTEKEALIKLQYDLYYIKNRDIGLDTDIALRTLAVIVSAKGR